MPAGATAAATRASNKRVVLYVLQTLVLSSLLFILLAFHAISGIRKEPSQHQVSSANFQQAEARNPFELEPPLLVGEGRQDAWDFQASRACYLGEPSKTDFCANVLALGNAMQIANKYRFPLLLTLKWREFIETYLDGEFFARLGEGAELVRFIANRLPANSVRLQVNTLLRCESPPEQLGKILAERFRVAPKLQSTARRIALMLGNNGGNDKQMLEECHSPDGGGEAAAWLIFKAGGGSMQEQASNVWSSVQANTVFITNAGSMGGQHACQRVITAWRSQAQPTFNAPLLPPAGCSKYVASISSNNNNARTGSTVCANV